MIGRTMEDGPFEDPFGRDRKWYGEPLSFFDILYSRVEFTRFMDREEYEAGCESFLEGFLLRLEDAKSRESMIGCTQRFIMNQKDMVRYAESGFCFCDLRDLAWIPSNLALFGEAVLLSLLRRDCPKEGLDPEAVRTQSRRILKKGDRDFERMLEDVYKALSIQGRTGS